MSITADSNTSQYRERSTGADALRWLAVVLVVVSHSWLFWRGSEPVMFYTSDVSFELGRIGVIIFFCVSGHLVAASSQRDSRLGPYLLRRFSRIYPGYAVMLLILVLIVGPAVTTAPGYWGDVATWQFLGRNLLVVPFAYPLPGVFESSVVPYANGTIWTLGPEVILYIALIVIVRFGTLHRKALPLTLVGLTVLSLIASWGAAVSLVIVDGFSAYVVTTYAQLASAFLLCASLRLLGGGPAWLGMVLVAGAIFSAALHLPTSILIVPSLAIITHWLTRVGIPKVNLMRLGDPTFGIYIYGFIVQQLIYTSSDRIYTPAGFAVLSLCISAVAGYLSWWLIEAPSLRRAATRLSSAPGSRQVSASTQS